MNEGWQNNRISKKLNEEYPRDFSICDIDGTVRCYYSFNGFKIRFIIYESKNKNEKLMGKSQLDTLKTLRDSIDWPMFDNISGIFVIKVIDLDDELRWYNLEKELIRTTTFQELYEIFSCKDIEN